MDYSYPPAAGISIVQGMINRNHALRLATGWVKANIGVVGPNGMPLQFEKFSINRDTYIDPSGMASQVWLVYFLEAGASQEPNGIVVIVDQITGECKRADLE